MHLSMPLSLCGGRGVRYHSGYHLISIRCYYPEMESKTARLTLLIDPNKKRAFETLCAQQDLTPSQVVRQLIREYLAKHGAAYRRSEERRVGKECVRKGRSRWSPSH